MSLPASLKLELAHKLYSLPHASSIENDAVAATCFKIKNLCISTKCTKGLTQQTECLRKGICEYILRGSNISNI